MQGHAHWKEGLSSFLATACALDLVENTESGSTFTSIGATFSCEVAAPFTWRYTQLSDIKY
jgi:hypothetical protein